MAFENHFPRPESVIFCMSDNEARDIQELGNRSELLGLLVDHHCRAHAAIRMASAADLAPIGAGSVNQVREVRERAHQRKREPVACRFGDTDLGLHVVGQMRQRVSLAQPAFRGDVFIAAGERHRLERDERDLLGIVHREPDDRTHLIVVHAVDQRDDQNDFDAGLVQVVDRPQLHVEQIADLAVAVGIVADAVELQIGVTKSGFGRLLGRIPCSWRTRYRWSPPECWSSRACGRRRPHRRKYGDMVGSPPEN